MGNGRFHDLVCHGDVDLQIAQREISTDWIAAFTASTSFANPAVTLARTATDIFAGIRPADVLGFIVAELAGAFAATILFRRLVPSLSKDVDAVVVSHAADREAQE